MTAGAPYFKEEGMEAKELKVKEEKGVKETEEEPSLEEGLKQHHKEK